MTKCVDAHVHLHEKGFWPRAYFDFVATRRANAAPGAARPTEDEVEAGYVDPGGERLLAQMNELGIDHAVLLTLDWELGMESPAPVSIGAVHSRYAEIGRASDGRLIVFAGIDPRRENAAEILQTARAEGAARGFKLYPPIGVYPHDDIMMPIYQTCMDWGIPVAVHTGLTVPYLRPRFSNPLYIQDVLRKFPNLTIWIMHAGADYWWHEAVNVARSGHNAYIELSGWQQLAELDEREFVKMLAHAVNHLGPHRILFGSDHFSGTEFRDIETWRWWISWFRDLPAIAKKHGFGISDEAVELILGGNAARCLGLDN